MARLTSVRSASALALTALALAMGLLASACATDPEVSADAPTPAAAAETTTPLATTPEPSSTEAPDQTSPTDAEVTEATAEPDPPAPIVEFDLLSSEMTNVATGESVDLATVADGKPLVLWFWAPH